MGQTANKGSTVLEAKLFPGVGAARVLKRSHLIPPPEFREGTSTVAVVAAPAGYGKSTLLSGWHALFSEQGLACGWLTIDSADDDPARLMRHLVAAFQRIDPTMGRGAIEELVSDVANGARPALESLAGDLSQLRGRAVLFLDDLQLITAPQALEIIDWLINYSPESCRYVIGTRETQRLRLGGLRVRGRLSEFGPRELRFTDDEARRFLSARLGHDVESEDVRQLVAKTEGWPAALELAALALRSGADRATVIERFSGTDVSLVDYLGEVVMERLDARTRDFVLRIALFDRVNGEMAAEITDEPDAARILSGLHSGNLFLTPLDRAGEWFRFHPLAAEFFRDRFRRDGGNAAQTISIGADWLYRNGFDEEAINAAISARAWQKATQWVAESVEELVYRRGYHQTILRWMKQLPTEWVDRFPQIRIHYAFALTFSPFQQEVDAQVHRLESIHAGLARDEHADSALADRILSEIELQKLLSQALRDDGLAAGASAQAWLARWPDAPLLRRGTVANVLIFGLKTSGDIDRGLAIAEQSRKWLQQAEGWYSLSWTEYLTALLHLKRGAYFEARRAAETALELLNARLEGHPAHAAMLHSVLATVAYEFGELEKTRQHIERCLPRVGESGHTDAVILGFLAAAKLERIQRGEEAGLSKLQEGQELGERRGLPRVTISLAAEECGWHSRSERFDEARRVATRRGFSSINSDDIGTLSGTKAILVASRFLLRTQPREVVIALDGAIERSRAKGLHFRLVELLMLRALALRHNGQIDDAVSSLHDALGVAAPRHYYRVLLDEAPDLVSLFDRLDSARLRGTAAAPLARRLIEAMRASTEPRERRSESDNGMLAEELSKRELGILKRLESDLSTKEIADAIFITPGTLKWHLHNIYGKLGVRGRSGAVSKARVLKLI